MPYVTYHRRRACREHEAARRTRLTIARSAHLALALGHEVATYCPIIPESSRQRMTHIATALRTAFPASLDPSGNPSVGNIGAG